MPQNLFFGIIIAPCIVVLKKSRKKDGVFFINASNEFIHEGNKNKLSDENIKTILNTYIKKEDKEHFCKFVNKKTIGENDYSLFVADYVK